MGIGYIRNFSLSKSAERRANIYCHAGKACKLAYSWKLIYEETHLRGLPRCICEIWILGSVIQQ